jgi:DMSO/TMAO reductase YedYZ molybdopterin-dependent catalytic subunit
MLVYEMNGRPLEPQHGYPLRLLAPGWYGMTSVKWLARIDAVTEPFEGYQQAVAYRFQSHEDEPGDPVSRIRVRALMIPPGVPDFPDRARRLDAGPVTLRGRAWCGTSSIDRVEVGIDGDWQPTELGRPVGAWAWRSWSYDWAATVGSHQLACRATDADGNVQPPEVKWNLQGMANNLIQTIDVTVR